MKKITIYLIIFISGVTISCKDFLREISQNDAYIDEVVDLEELLAGECYMNRISRIKSASIAFSDGEESAFGVKDMLTFIHVMDDDIKENIIDYESRVADSKYTPYSQLYNFYRWSEEPFRNNRQTEIDDPYWKNFYYRIAVLNSILVGADELEEKGKSITELSRVRGESLFLRAWNYFMLVNIYGLPYDKNTPEDPNGIPLKTVPEVMDKDFTRNTVGEVYRQIVKDLEDAVENFKLADQMAILDVYTPGLQATYAFLSRVYLYMCEYEKTIDVANKVFGFLLQDMLNIDGNFANTQSRETIFTQGSNVLYLLFPGEGEYRVGMIPWRNPETGVLEMIRVEIKTDLTYSYAVSDDLAKLFDKNDLRYNVFFTRGGYTGNLICRKFGVDTETDEYDPDSHEVLTISSDGSATSSCGWIRYSEVLLNKIEAQACLGDAEVNLTLNDFLSSRYKTPPIVPSSGMELISFIRNERRKELCFEGHRWFDLRRYAVSSFPEKIEVTHTCFDIDLNVDDTWIIKNAGTRTLKSYSESTKGLWTVPIPAYVIEDNHGAMKNNPRNEGVESNIK